MQKLLVLFAELNESWEKRGGSFVMIKQARDMLASRSAEVNAATPLLSKSGVGCIIYSRVRTAKCFG
jgi:hypothetical protein